MEDLVDVSRGMIKAVVVAIQQIDPLQPPLPLSVILLSKIFA